MKTVKIESSKVVKSTKAAILVNSPNFKKDTWVPQSVVDDDSEVWHLGQEGTLIVAEWWAEKEGLV